MTDTIDLIDKTEMCAELGGISSATLWRGVKSGKFPKPIKVGAFIARWKRGDGKAVLQALLDQRGK